MMLYASSCERPSKSSSSVFFPSSVSNTYSFSTGTQGSSRRFSAALRPSSPCSASSFASSSRAACHSSCVPTVCSVIALPPSSCSWKCRPVRAAKLIGRGAPSSLPQHSVQVVEADPPAPAVGVHALLAGDAVAGHPDGRRPLPLGELELDQLPLGVLVVPRPGEGEPARWVDHRVLAGGAVVLAGLRIPHNDPQAP